MRDDIHKKAPGGRHWKRLVRDCARDADWVSSGPTAALAAIRRELAEGSGPALFRPLLVKQDALFADPAAASRLLSRVTQGQVGLTGIQRLALQAFERLSVIRPLGPQLVRECLAVAVRQRADAWIRELDAFTALNFPRQQKEIVRRVRAAVRNAPIDDLVSQAANGRLLPVMRPRKEAFDVDAPISN